MSQGLPETKSVFFVTYLIPLLAFVVIALILAFIVWPDVGGGWLSGLRDLLKLVRI